MFGTDERFNGASDEKFAALKLCMSETWREEVRHRTWSHKNSADRYRATIARHSVRHLNDSAEMRSEAEVVEKSLHFAGRVAVVGALGSGEA